MHVACVPWLNPPLTALRYVMYFRSYRCRILIPWNQRAESSKALYLGVRQFAVQVGHAQYLVQVHQNAAPGGSLLSMIGLFDAVMSRKPARTAAEAAGAMTSNGAVRSDPSAQTIYAEILRVAGNGQPSEKTDDKTIIYSELAAQPNNNNNTSSYS